MTGSLLTVWLFTGLPVWQTQSESAFHLFVCLFFSFFCFFRVGKSLACHSPAK